MAEYKKLKDEKGADRTDMVLRQDGYFVPEDAEGADWQRYLRWLAEGGIPDPADAMPEIAESVTWQQWVLALADTGSATAWETAVAGVVSKYRVRIGAYARNTIVFATDPLVARICGTALPFSALFAHAKTMPTT